MRSEPATPMRVVVERVERETADAVSLVLRAADPGRPLAPGPGQFLTVRLPGGQARCYSFSRTGPEPRITVKRLAGGAGSTWLCEEAGPGTLLTVLPPEGTFAPRSWDGDLLLAAGGSGITPVLPLARAALERGRGRVAIVYANRDEASVIFRDELIRLAAAHPGRLLLHHLLDSVQGPPGHHQLTQLLAPYREAELLLCGPAPFMAAVERAARALGTPRERIRREVFRSLDGDPFAAPEEAAAPGPGGAGPPAALGLTLDGALHELPWPGGTTLLAALLAHGVDAPFSCREGACGACACRVLSGEVAAGDPGVLTAEDLAEGYVLACQALPPGDGSAVRVSYD
ncbi:ferredoxin--NADP reductase [Streptomyces albidoflavus]